MCKIIEKPDQLAQVRNEKIEEYDESNHEFYKNYLLFKKYIIICVKLAHL